MATGFPTKANWVSGDILTAAQMDDLAGTVNALSNAAATSGSVLVSNVAGTSFAYQPLQAAGKNAVINGGMDIWQRGTSVALAASSPYTSNYNADRWQVGTLAALEATTISRQATADTTNLPNIQYAARVQRNSGQTGVAAIYFGQSLETVNSIPYAGKQVTISYYARAGANFSATANVFNSTITTGTGTDQNLFPGYTGSVLNTSYDTLTSTWQRFTHTITLASTTSEIGVYFNYTPTGTAGANDYFEITGVQLELGSTATTFSRAGGSIGGELALCQRYYYRNTASSVYMTFGTGQAYSTTAAYINVQTPVPMRIAPSTTIEASTLACTLSAGTFTPITLVMNYPGTTNSLMTATAGGSVFTAGNGTIMTAANSTSAYLGLSAEL